MPRQSGAEAPDPAQRAVLLGTLAGTVVEWYDFSIYGFLSVVLAQHFFPAGDPTVSLLGAYLSFALAYAVRPIAGVALGRLADSAGRRGVLAGIILLTGFATFAIGLVPGYEQIGIAAPVLIVLLRVLQGVGASGEWTLGTTFLLESSPRARWPVLGSYISLTYYISLTLGTGLAAALSAGMGPAFATWGWRILFLLTAPMALVGQYIRKRLDETPEFRRIKAERQDEPRLPLLGALRTQWRPILAYIGVSAQQRVAQFALSTFVITALVEAGLGQSGAFLVSTLTYVLSIPLVLIGGRLGRRWGPVFPMALGMGCLAVTAVPTFLLLDSGQFWWTLLAETVFSFGVVVGSGPSAALMISIFRPEVRGAATGLSYNVCTVLFGSTAPLVATWLHGWTGSNLAFAWYTAGISVLGVPALLVCRRYLRVREREPELVEVPG
ncbi:MFS transporter [Kutzneria viridogrisea]|uniref:MHS family proline/betaine transporter-like MFS transporter n=1 Tax=Kutzneria viridogrisea TaxID=47990 RepID=A0ABR6BW86_9PSEU|nr:MHS family proline/betaine transporter-like MFS transporter [Kutzneria viridogrisea]